MHKSQTGGQADRQPVMHEFCAVCSMQKHTTVRDRIDRILKEQLAIESDQEIML